MRKKQIGGLIIAAVLFIAIGVTSVLTHLQIVFFHQELKMQ